MRIHIKNIVCDRCIMATNAIFREAGIKLTSVKPGEAELAEDIGTEQIRPDDINLRKLGFDIIEDHKGRIIEKN